MRMTRLMRCVVAPRRLSFFAVRARGGAPAPLLIPPPRAHPPAERARARRPGTPHFLATDGCVWPPRRPQMRDKPDQIFKDAMVARMVRATKDIRQETATRVHAEQMFVASLESYTKSLQSGLRMVNKRVARDD